jgi:16S rRNA G527 N7-methylase RsmG
VPARARQPGIVFARAAANQEVDPLEDNNKKITFLVVKSYVFHN